MKVTINGANGGTFSVSGITMAKQIESDNGNMLVAVTREDDKRRKTAEYRGTLKRVTIE